MRRQNIYTITPLLPRLHQSGGSGDEWSRGWVRGQWRVQQSPISREGLGQSWHRTKVISPSPGLACVSHLSAYLQIPFWLILSFMHQLLPINKQTPFMPSCDKDWKYLMCPVICNTLFLTARRYFKQVKHFKYVLIMNKWSTWLDKQ